MKTLIISTKRGRSSHRGYYRLGSNTHTHTHVSWATWPALTLVYFVSCDVSPPYLVMRTEDWSVSANTPNLPCGTKMPRPSCSYLEAWSPKCIGASAIGPKWPDYSGRQMKSQLREKNGESQSKCRVHVRCQDLLIASSRSPLGSPCSLCSTQTSAAEEMASMEERRELVSCTYVCSPWGRQTIAPADYTMDAALTTKEFYIPAVTNLSIIRHSAIRYACVCVYICVLVWPQT